MQAYSTRKAVAVQKIMTSSAKKKAAVRLSKTVMSGLDSDQKTAIHETFGSKMPVTEILILFFAGFYVFGIIGLAIYTLFKYLYKKEALVKENPKVFLAFLGFLVTFGAVGLGLFIDIYVTRMKQFEKAKEALDANPLHCVIERDCTTSPTEKCAEFQVGENGTQAGENAKSLCEQAHGGENANRDNPKTKAQQKRRMNDDKDLVTATFAAYAAVFSFSLVFLSVLVYEERDVLFKGSTEVPDDA